MSMILISGVDRNWSGSIMVNIRVAPVDKSRCDTESKSSIVPYISQNFVRREGRWSSNFF